MQISAYQLTDNPDFENEDYELEPGRSFFATDFVKYMALAGTSELIDDINHAQYMDGFVHIISFMWEGENTGVVVYEVQVEE